MASRKLRILCLHGWTQNGAIMERKTHAIRRNLDADYGELLLFVLTDPNSQGTHLNLSNSLSDRSYPSARSRIRDCLGAC